MTELLIDDEWLNPDGTEHEWLVDFKRCQKWLEDALEYDNAGTYSIQDICDEIASNRMHLWPGEESAVVTQILVYPQCKHLHILLAGGNLEELERMAPSVIDFAKYFGCSRITLAGRRGWGRTWVRKFGMKPLYYWMYAEV